MIHPLDFVPKGSNNWCVPTAIRAATGAAERDIVRHLRRLKGQSASGGVADWYTIRVLWALGYGVWYCWLPPATYTLHDLHRDGWFRAGRVYLVSGQIPGRDASHMIVYRDGRVQDNGTWFSRRLGPISERGGSARVFSVREIVPRWRSEHMIDRAMPVFIFAWVSAAAYCLLQAWLTYP
ncbi:MAG: hypothetical protein OXC11_13510 [Rhodospirillales bacterium]|nr:hypothetical protein [Rhodospirillales bacterium]